jgi:hypothetical protein
MATQIFVQFSDSTDETIVSVFSCAQDPKVWKNQGVVPSDDARYESYYNAMTPSIQAGMVKPGD